MRAAKMIYIGSLNIAFFHETDKALLETILDIFIQKNAFFITCKRLSARSELDTHEIDCFTPNDKEIKLTHTGKDVTIIWAD